MHKAGKGLQNTAIEEEHQTKPANLPRVSVLLPVYNADPAHLKDAVDSIMQQTYQDFELLIIDDGSTGPCAIYLDNVKEERIRLIRFSSNQGLTAALNRGLAEATGQLIARMDADDISLPNRLETQVEMLDANPFFTIIGSAVQIFESQTDNREMKDNPSHSEESKEKKKITPSEHRIITHPTHPALVHWSMFFYCSLSHPTVMMRRTTKFDEIKYSNEFQYCEDYCLWTHCLSGNDINKTDHNTQVRTTLYFFLFSSSLCHKSFWLVAIASVHISKYIQRSTQIEKARWQHFFEARISAKGGCR